MKWMRALGRRERSQPRGSNYRVWKPQVAGDCFYRCVYCAVSDSLEGVEIRFFTIDHFRPKSKFTPLKTKVWNLYYCCAICNSYKQDDWPGDVTNTRTDIGFLDPGRHDYNEYFDTRPDGTVISAYATGAYMIEKMNLNRGQLVCRRRVHGWREWAKRVAKIVPEIMESTDDPDELRTLTKVLLRLQAMRDKLDEARVTPDLYTR